MRASLGRPFRALKALYLRPIIYTTDAERVYHSALWWGLVERQGTIMMRKGLKYAPRSYRRRARIGRFLARKLGLQPAEFKWREQITVEENKWALSLKAIVYSVRHPKPVGTGGVVTVEPEKQQMRYDITTGEYVASRVVIPQSVPKKPADLPDAIEIAWAEMTPSERRTATRRANRNKTVAI